MKNQSKYNYNFDKGGGMSDRVVYRQPFDPLLAGRFKHLVYLLDKKKDFQFQKNIHFIPSNSI